MSVMNQKHITIAVAALALASTLAACTGSKATGEQSTLNAITSPTNLGAVAKTAMVVSIIKMGTPFDPSPCQGFALGYSRLGKVAQIRGCVGDESVEKDVPLSLDQERRLIALLSDWSLEPVPASASSNPCPAFDGGGFRANALTSDGLESYETWACEGEIPEGILVAPTDDASTSELEQLVDELLAD